MNRLPIRIRVALLSAVAAALTAAVIGVVAAQLTAAAIRTDFDASLHEEAAEAYVAVQEGVSLSALTNPVYWPQQIAIYDSAGNVLDQTDEAPPAPAGGRAGEIFTTSGSPDGIDLRAVYLDVVRDDRVDRLVVAVPADSLHDRTRSAVIRIALIGLGAIALVGVGAYLLTGLVLGPIERLRRSAAELTGDRGGRRLEIPPADDEVRRLALTLNGALDRVTQTMETQRRFLAEASHDLRTPIARLRADLDLARRPTRTHDEVLAALADIDEHAVHLTTLADSLLDRLAPQTKPRVAPRPITVDQLIACLRARSLREFAVDVPAEVGRTPYVAELSTLVAVLLNLVENAFRHGAQPVEVTAAVSGGWLELAVRDHGPGIPAELREQVLEPFLQGRGATSGSGLGLSIARDFAAGCAGELIIEDAAPGCRAVLRLPLVPPTA